MKVESASGQLGDPLHAGSVPTISRLCDYYQLTKPRVTLLVVLTAVASFYLAASVVDILPLLHLSLGTLLLVGGTSVLNQFIEREADGKMRRTMGRPLPAKRLEATEALVFGVLLTGGGILYLSITTNLLTGLVGFLGAVVYLFVYTPLKKRSLFCTFVGAFPGASPMLLGWAAARNSLELEAWLLFSLLFLWQFPHFLAISWVYREDYERGGFLMLPVVDRDGKKTAWRILIYTVLLLGVSLLPTFLGMAGIIYAIGALIMGAMFLWFSAQVVLNRSRESARHVLRASVAYLPLLLLLMVLDRI